MEKQRNRETEKQRNREIEKQSNRETDGQTDRKMLDKECSIQILMQDSCRKDELQTDRRKEHFKIKIER